MDESNNPNPNENNNIPNQGQDPYASMNPDFYNTNYDPLDSSNTVNSGVNEFDNNQVLNPILNQNLSNANNMNNNAPDMNFQDNNFSDPNMNFQDNGFNDPNLHSQDNSFNDPNMNSQDNGFNDPNMNSQDNNFSDPNMNSQGNGFNDPNLNSQDNGFNDPNMNSQDNGFNDPNMNSQDNGFNDPNMNSQDNGFNDPNMNSQDNGFNDPNMSSQDNGFNDPNMNYQDNGFNDPNMNSQDNGFNDPNMNFQDNGFNDPNMNFQDNGFNNPNMNFQDNGFNDPNMNSQDNGFNDPNMNFQDNGFNDPNMNFQDNGFNDPNMNYQNNGFNDPNMNYQNNNFNDPNMNYQNNNFNDPNTNYQNNNAQYNNQGQINNNVSDDYNMDFVRAWMGNLYDKAHQKKFNCCAAFLQESYLFYRKMYLTAILTLLLKNLTLFLSLFLLNSMGPFALAIYLVIVLIFIFAFGFGFYPLYRNFVKNKLNKFKQTITDNSQLVNMASQKGGTSPIAVVLYCVVQTIITIATSTIMVNTGLLVPDSMPNESDNETNTNIENTTVQEQIADFQKFEFAEGYTIEYDSLSWFLDESANILVKGNNKLTYSGQALENINDSFGFDVTTPSGRSSLLDSLIASFESQAATLNIYVQKGSSNFIAGTSDSNVFYSYIDIESEESLSRNYLILLPEDDILFQFTLEVSDTSIDTATNAEVVTILTSISKGTGTDSSNGRENTVNVDTVDENVLEENVLGNDIENNITDENSVRNQVVVDNTTGSADLGNILG